MNRTARRVYKRKSGKNGLFIISAVVLAALIVFFFGNAAYKAVKEKYLLNNYPIRYQQLVEKYAAENNVDKFLIYAIIKTESNFNSDAVSNMGARGLMQIMDETFQWVRFRLGDDEGLGYDAMFDEEQNIRYGCYLVGYLLRYFENEDAAICAYHAGVGNVDSWLSNPDYSADGKSLDAVPMSDTNHYLSKVKNALDIYQTLYKEEF